MSDFHDTEAFRLGDIYAGLGEDNDGLTFEECIARAEYNKVNTLATLAGLDDDCYARQRERLRLSAKIGLTGKGKRKKTSLYL